MLVYIYEEKRKKTTAAAAAAAATTATAAAGCCLLVSYRVWRRPRRPPPRSFHSVHSSSSSSSSFHPSLLVFVCPFFLLFSPDAMHYCHLSHLSFSLVLFLPLNSDPSFPLPSSLPLALYFCVAFPLIVALSKCCLKHSYSSPLQYFHADSTPYSHSPPSATSSPKDGPSN